MFYSFDFDLDPMTLILKLGLDMVMMYLHTKNKVPTCNTSIGLNRQTAILEIITHLHGDLRGSQRYANAVSNLIM